MKEVKEVKEVSDVSNVNITFYKWYKRIGGVCGMTNVLIDLKNAIENLTKNYQIEVLDFFHKIPRIKLNENENGIFINIGLLEKPEIQQLQQKLESFKNLENLLVPPIGTAIATTK